MHRPGDDEARRLYTRQRDDDGTANATYLESWQFYDGLGRLLQSQAESEEAGDIVLANRTYPTLRIGQAMRWASCPKRACPTR